MKAAPTPTYGDVFRVVTFRFAKTRISDGKPADVNKTGLCDNETKHLYALCGEIVTKQYLQYVVMSKNKINSYEPKVVNNFITVRFTIDL